MTKAKDLTGGETLLRAFSNMGIDHIFASPGSEWSPVWEALAKRRAGGEGGPTYLSCRHEETAVGMASGYAKATGKLPAVLIHTTVGALHAGMALRGALHEQIAMVVCTGESIGFGEDEGPDPGGQWLRHLADVGGPARLVERCVKWSFGVNTKAILAATIQRACQLAIAAPQGPTFVSIPIEFLFAETSDNGFPSALPSQPCADPRGVDELASLLVGAQNPIIISEEAGRNAATVEKLVELAELLGCPVVETRSTTFLNFPRNHPLHGGFDPQEYLADADAVFLLSTVLPWHSRSAAPRPGTKIAVLDQNPLHTELPFWSYPVHLCLVGELRSSLLSLVDRVKSRLGDTTVRDRRAESWRNRFQERRQRWQEEALSLKNQKPIDTRWAVYELSRSLPSNVAVVEETITHRAAVHRYLDRLAPGSFFAGCTGGLGTGLATALGVKVATPERTVVAVIGDGSFNYNPALAALGFAQEYAKPILIVLLNNSGYLSMKAGLRSYYPSGWAMRTETFIGTSIAPSPDYAAIAGAFGGHGEKVEEPAAIGAALERGLRAVDSGRIALIDIRLDPVNPL